MLSIHAEKLREKAVRLSLKTTIKKAAQEYDITPRTVNYWKAKMIKEGKLSLQVADNSEDEPRINKAVTDNQDFSNESFVKEAMVVRMKLLRQIERRIEKFTTLKEILEVFKVINDAILRLPAALADQSKEEEEDIFCVGEKIYLHRKEIQEKQDQAIAAKKEAEKKYLIN